MSEDELDEWIVKNSHDVSMDSEPVYAVFTEDLRGLLNDMALIGVAEMKRLKEIEWMYNDLCK